jgi:alkylglycerol monooxygenase
MGTTFPGLRAMFYLLLPSETYYERIEDVPNYVVKAIRLFLALQVLEFAIAWYRGKIKPRFNDTFSSMTAGVLSRVPQLFIRSIELSAYIWIYEHVRIFPHLSWNSPLTYWVAFMGMDFGYYWFHRMAHEVNLFWSTHQTHHSAEDYNLSTALRQGVLQVYFSWVFYLPLALLVPPQIFLIHSQMNLLYQFWIHTDIISNLGPFEYILNTPSHHRVHHGRNPYCIDKNYGGVLIIWDRLFGTFAAERKNEEIAYGLIHPINTFDPLETQFCHLKYMCQQFFQIEGWQNKLSIIWKGPGWQPGLSRLGSDDFPQINYPIHVYHPNVSTELSAYTFVHFLYVTIQYSALLTHAKVYPNF